jgi:hypothetical protein
MYINCNTLTMKDIINEFNSMKTINNADKEVILDIGGGSIYTQYIPVLKKLNNEGYNIILSNVRNICTPVKNYCVDNNIFIK